MYGWQSYNQLSSNFSPIKLLSNNKHCIIDKNSFKVIRKVAIKFARKKLIQVPSFKNYYKIKHLFKKNISLCKFLFKTNTTQKPKGNKCQHFLCLKPKGFLHRVNLCHLKSSSPSPTCLSLFLHQPESSSFLHSLSLSTWDSWMIIFIPHKLFNL